MKKALLIITWLVGLTGLTFLANNGENAPASFLSAPQAEVKEITNKAPEQVTDKWIEDIINEALQEVEKEPYVAPTVNFVPTAQPTATVSTVRKTQPYTKLSNDNYYINVDGNTVHSPAYSNTVPAGASAKCRDGTYSFSQNRRGTCSHHGGVAYWL